VSGPAWLHAPAGLVASVVVSRLAALAGVGKEEQGLQLRDAPRGIAYGLAAALPIAVLMISGAAVERSRAFYREERFRGLSSGRTVYEVLVRVPVGTALPEEVIFRGALPGLLAKRYGRRRATLVASLLFGLWHIVPTVRRLDLTGRPRAQRAVWVAGTVAAMAAAGFCLAWLRYRSRSIVAPWIAHSAANATGLACAWLIGRRT
jgi:membrane protease YdiL (CAAX protease family)